MKKTTSEIQKKTDKSGMGGFVFMDYVSPDIREFRAYASPIARCLALNWHDLIDETLSAFASNYSQFSAMYLVSNYHMAMAAERKYKVKKNGWCLSPPSGGRSIIFQNVGDACNSLLSCIRNGGLGLPPENYITYQQITYTKNDKEEKEYWPAHVSMGFARTPEFGLLPLVLHTHDKSHHHRFENLVVIYDEYWGGNWDLLRIGP